MAGHDAEVSTLLRVLAEPRRRLALAALCEHGEVSLPDLAEVVAEGESGHRVEEIPPERVTRVYFSLYHKHVPELEDAGLVRYEQEHDLVVFREGGVETLRHVRELIDDILSD